MNIRIGDRIRFLNDVGGGVVIDIQQDTNQAIIQQDDGFDFPVPINECVVVKKVELVESKPIVVSKPPAAKPYDINKDIKRLQDAFSNRNTSKIPIPKPKQIRKAAPVAEIIEVDLHISKLLDSTAGMSSGDMLEYQLDVVRQTIAEHEKYTGQKIVFIHGKGDGVLRCAIEQELKRLGRQNKTQCAPFKRYGFGALIVIM